MPGDTGQIPVLFRTFRVVKQAPEASGKEKSCYRAVALQAVPQQRMDMVSEEI